MDAKLIRQPHLSQQYVEFMKKYRGLNHMQVINYEDKDMLNADYF